MNYMESKNQLDAIRNKYGCKGDIIFRTAIQMVVENGQNSFKDENWFEDQMDFIDKRHDSAESVGKILLITREFEKALMECAKELANINTCELLIYIQREVWFGGKVGEPDYRRAMQIIRDCLCYTADNFGAYPCESAATLEDFRNMGLADEEIEYFGWSYLFDIEEEEE